MKKKSKKKKVFGVVGQYDLTPLTESQANLDAVMYARDGSGDQWVVRMVRKVSAVEPDEVPVTITEL